MFFLNLDLNLIILGMKNYFFAFLFLRTVPEYNTMGTNYLPLFQVEPLAGSSVHPDVDVPWPSFKDQLE